MRRAQKCNHRLLSSLVVPTRPFSGGKGIWFTMVVEGKLPTKAKVQIGRGRPYIPAECRAWRNWISAWITGNIKIKGHKPIRLRDVNFTIVGYPPPDRDTVYHQLQDALTLDPFDLDDKWTGGVSILPVYPTNKSTNHYVVSGEYIFGKEE